MDKWFGGGIAAWYRQNKRDLPWRLEKDPYKIWLSEIILQQTQVAQGLAYYLRFCEHFPTVTDLAQATEDQVLKLWQGLGYYSRARNLHQAAKSIVEQFNGEFPRDYEGIRTLKGVGDYTAAAIASFAYNQPYAVVDGNVFRVLSRVFGLDVPIDTGTGKKLFSELAASLLNRSDPATHNQAIMEFGSQFCRPSQPDCKSCIFGSRCFAHRHGLVMELPKKSKKTAVKQRYFNYLVLADRHGRVVVHRRNSKDIWQGLYEFVLIETSAKTDTADLLKGAVHAGLPKKGVEVKYVSKEYVHLLTHQRLHAKFIVLKLKRKHPPSVSSVGIPELSSFAFSRLTEKFLHDCRLKEII